MGHHIDAAKRFQSDKPFVITLTQFEDGKPVLGTVGPDKIVLSFHDPAARDALKKFADRTADRGLGEDVLDRCYAIDAGQRIDARISELANVLAVQLSVEGQEQPIRMALRKAWQHVHSDDEPA